VVLCDDEGVLVAPERWPERTRRVYAQLRTYGLVGASAGLAAIVEALGALGAASRESRGALAEVEEAGRAFCALKPDTAAYQNASSGSSPASSGAPRPR
jgi:hypothetical protein